MRERQLSFAPAPQNYSRPEDGPPAMPHLVRSEEGRYGHLGRLGTALSVAGGLALGVALEHYQHSKASAASEVDYGKRNEFSLRPEEDWHDPKKLVSAFASYIENEDLEGTLAHLHKFFFAWTVYQNEAGRVHLGRDGAAPFFREAFANGNPRCVAFKEERSEGNDEIRVHFEDLRALGGTTGHTIMTLQVSNYPQVPSGWVLAEELTPAQLNSLRAELATWTPCREERPTPTPESQEVERPPQGVLQLVGLVSRKDVKELVNWIKEKTLDFHWGFEEVGLLFGQNLDEKELARMLRNAFENGNPRCSGYMYFSVDQQGDLVGVLFEDFKGHDLHYRYGGMGRAVFMLRRDPGQDWQLWYVREITESRWNREEHLRLPFEQPYSCPEAEIQELSNDVFFAQGFTSTSRGSGGGGISELSLEVRSDLRRNGHTGVTMNDWSWAGYEITQNGNYEPKQQSCTDTLNGKDEQAELALQFLREWQALHPRSIQTIATHSWGSIPWLEALQRVKDGTPGTEGIDVSKIRLIVTSGPNQGLDKWILRHLAKIWPDMDEECQTIFRSPLPSPSGLETPSGRDMTEIFDLREERTHQLEELTAWMRGQGGEIYALVNYHDCVLAVRFCELPRPLVEIMFIKDRVPRILRTQEIPGAVNILRFIDVEGQDIGRRATNHDAFWKTEEGREILVELIGGPVITR